ncbi:histone-lysine N-methyltransferase SETMAR [Trichonephila clavipes]|nr:histone-lysine N-methyltransferase SETMAR [Trichonephila clavipes]
MPSEVPVDRWEGVDELQFIGQAYPTYALLDSSPVRFGWDVFGHPSYSPDLTPSDFHLFLHLKSFLAGKHFNNDKELKENVSNWLKTQAATFYEEGIEKLVPRYDTYLQNFGSYVER